MLQKIKELMQLKGEIDSINRNVADSSKIISELKAELESLKSELKESNSLYKEFIKSLSSDVALMKSSREELAGEIYEFRLIKSQLQRKILDKFEEELKKELGINMEALKKDAGEYSGLKSKVGQMLSKIDMANEEMKKFIEISSGIKKEDFELTKFARHLMEMDREKLELMRKIDTLERLISKIRRREVIR